MNVVNIIPIKFIKLHPNAKPFAYTRDEDACMDMFALKDIPIPVGHTTIVETGIALEIPFGFEGQIRGRSGLSSKGINVHFGTVESTYRGDVGIVITNNSNAAFYIKKHNRIAQFTIKPIIRIKLEEAKELTKTERGIAGYGSSGI